MIHIHVLYSKELKYHIIEWELKIWLKFLGWDSCQILHSAGCTWDERRQMHSCLNSHVDWGSQNYILHGCYDSLFCPVTELNFAFKWISWIQILSTRRHRRQSGLMTEGIPHGWNKRTLGSIGHRNSAIEHFNYMEQKAYKIHDQDWVAIWELTMELFQQCFMDCHDPGTCKMPGIAL